MTTAPFAVERLAQGGTELIATIAGQRFIRLMKIISFIEARHGNVMRKILEHSGLWQDPPSRAPPQPTGLSRSVRSMPEPDGACGITYEVDHDFLEHALREDVDQSDLRWEP